MFSAANSYLSHAEDSSTRAVLTWLCRLEPFWLLLLAVPVTLPGLLPPATQPFAIAGLFLFWPIRWWAAPYVERRFRLGPWPIWLLLLWLPVNLLAAGNQPATWAATGYLLLGLVLYVAVINHGDLQQRTMLFGWLLLLLTSVLVVSAPPLVEWKSNFRLFYMPIYDWFQAIPSGLDETIHANILAGALVQLFAISLALALPPKVRSIRLPQTMIPTTQAGHHSASQQDDEEDDSGQHDSGQKKRVRIRRQSRDRWRQAGAALLALLTLGLLLLTQSRGAYLGTGVVLLVLCSWRWPRLLYGLPLLVLGGGYLLYQLGAWSLFDLLGADNTFGGAEWRTEVWYAAGQAFHDFPYTGIGIGNFRAIIPLLYPNGAIMHEAATHAHNLFLQIGLDLGLPGLLAWLFLIGGSIGQAIRTLRRPYATAAVMQHDEHESHRRRQRRLIHLARQHNETLALSAGALAALSGLLVHGTLDAVTWGTKLAFLPWLLLAIIQLNAAEQAD